MKRLSISIVLFVFAFSLYAQSRKNSLPSPNEYVTTITENELSAHLHFLASDAMQGRKVGSAFELLAAEYLSAHYRAMEVWPLQAAGGNSNPYLQSFDFTLNQSKGKSQNVVAWLEGTDPKLKDEFILVTAHYDHLGTGTKTENDSIFNGAADDASGTVALLEIAQALKAAQKTGVKFKRSIVFIHMGGEESGLLGSNYWVSKQPLVALEKTKAIINMDGVGGTDKPQAANANNYVYVLVNDSTSGLLDKAAARLNAEMKVNLDLLQPKNPEQFMSDNKPFEYELIPSIYFSTGLTEHYHTVSDEPQTINYAHMAKIVRLVYLVTAELASTNEVKSVRSDYLKTGEFFCPPCGCASDQKVFHASGICADCKMTLEPKWKKK